MTAVSFGEVSGRFRSPPGPVMALDEISLHFESREIVSIVGPSGCGKATLLNLVAVDVWLAPSRAS